MKVRTLARSPPSRTRYEIFAVDEIVDLPVADVLTCFFGQQGHDPEFRQGEIDHPFGHNGRFVSRRSIS
jgi:hypothetical protein